MSLPRQLVAEFIGQVVFALVEQVVARTHDAAHCMGECSHPPHERADDGADQRSEHSAPKKKPALGGQTR